MRASAGRAAHLGEAALDGVGGAQFGAQRSYEGKERQRRGQSAFQMARQGRVARAPVKAKLLERPLRTGQLWARQIF